MAETLLLREYQNAETVAEKNQVIVKSIRLNYPMWLVNQLKDDFIKIIEDKN